MYKILHYYPDFGAMGGIEGYIVSASQALLRGTRFKPTVVCSRNTRLFNELKKAAIPVYGIRTMSCFAHPVLRLFDLNSFLQLIIILWREKPDVVHVHIGQVENLLFKVLGYKVVYSFHGYGSLYSISATSQALRRWLKRRLRPLFRSMTPHMDRMLFVSRSERERMLREGYLPPGFTGQILHNGVDVRGMKQRAKAIDKNAQRQTLGIPREAICVSFINRLDSNKNPLGFIRLAEKIVAIPELQNVHFLMAGDGPLAGAVEDAVARSSIKTQFHLLGYRHDVPELMGCSDLVLFMPNLEGFGLGVLEAMATGTLFVARAAGGIAEIMDSTGAEELLVPLNDEDAMLEKTIALLRLPHEDRLQLSTRMEAQAMKFDFSLHMRHLEEVYSRVIMPFQSSHYGPQYTTSQ